MLADWLIDGTGAPPLRDPEIVVRSGHFAKVGAAAKKRPPYNSIQCFPGCTIVPGTCR